MRPHTFKSDQEWEQYKRCFQTIEIGHTIIVQDQRTMMISSAVVYEVLPPDPIYNSSTFGLNFVWSKSKTDHYPLPNFPTLRKVILIKKHKHRPTMKLIYSVLISILSPICRLSHSFNMRAAILLNDLKIALKKVGG